jgi:hypothetical protein
MAHQTLRDRVIALSKLLKEGNQVERKAANAELRRIAATTRLRGVVMLAKEALQGNLAEPKPETSGDAKLFGQWFKRLKTESCVQKFEETFGSLESLIKRFEAFAAVPLHTLKERNAPAAEFVKKHLKLIYSSKDYWTAFRILEWAVRDARELAGVDPVFDYDAESKKGLERLRQKMAEANRNVPTQIAKGE